jgi:predicted nucleotidyltransferase
MEENYYINQTTIKILALFRSDYETAIHVREIARSIQTDTKTVGIHLNRLENINVLKSTIRGRNKEYQLNIDNTVTKYYVILAETYTTITYLESNYLIKKLTGEILDRIDGTVILYGSYAKGEATEDSDVDLLVIPDKKIDSEAIAETGRITGKEINIKETDSVLFQEGLKENDPLICEIIKNHIVLKRIDSFVEAMWRYYEER